MPIVYRGKLCCEIAWRKLARILLQVFWKTQKFGIKNQYQNL